MMNKHNIREVITADSPYEATSRADEKYGKGNYTILNCEPFTEHKYFGLVKHEIYNLYIELKPDKETSEESKKLLIQDTNNKPVPIKYETQEEIVPNYYVEEPATTDAINHAGVTYNSHGKKHIMRYVDNMRSIQEGDSQPHSQKGILEAKPQKSDTEAATQILQQIQQIRAARGHSTIIDVPSNKNNHEINTNLTKQLQDLMNQMRSEMAELKKAVAHKLAEPINTYPCGLKAIKENLVNVDIPNDIADYIVKRVSESTSEDIHNDTERSMKAYEDWCNTQVNFTNELTFDPVSGPKIIALFGPTGVGKTTTIAKIAAPYTFGSEEKRKKIVFFTLDTFRLGATEQLAHYAQLYDIVLEVIYEPEELDKKLAEHYDKDLIIIDTAGRCPKKREELLRLNEYLSRLPNLSRYLVISATSKYIDMLNTIKCFNEIGFDNLIFTKLDETCSVGPMLAVLLYSKTPLAYFTNGQVVPYDILPANKDSFSKNILENTF